MKFKNENAQNTIEYLLLIAAVLVVVIFALRPNGIVTNALNQSIDETAKFVRTIADCTCYNEDGSLCAPKCGDKCCDAARGETHIICPVDCGGPGYHWEMTHQTACNTTCGAGQATRTYRCIYDGDGSVAADQRCIENTGAMPPTVLNCTDYSGCRWWHSGFGACNPISCGVGTQSQTVECRDPSNNRTDDSWCPAATRPVDSRDCENYDMCTYRWIYNAWQQCSNSCGEGTQNRIELCEMSNGTIMLNTNKCQASATNAREATTQNCTGITTCTYAWVYTWSHCVPECESSCQETATETCLRSDANFVPIADCVTYGTTNVRNVGPALTRTQTGGSCGCDAPEGGNKIPDMTTRRYYRNATVPCAGICEPEDRRCSSGVLSGSFVNPSCTPAVCADCPTAPGGALNHGQSRRYYETTSVACGSICNYQDRACYNGSLSGSYTNLSCSANACSNCSQDGVFVAHGNSATFWQATTVPCGSSCSSQSRTCSNGSLSGWYSYSGCTVAACVCHSDGCNGNCPAGCSYPTDPDCDGRKCVVVSEVQFCDCSNCGGPRERVNKLATQGCHDLTYGGITYQLWWCGSSLANWDNVLKNVGVCVSGSLSVISSTKKNEHYGSCGLTDPGTANYEVVYTCN